MKTRNLMLQLHIYDRLFVFGQILFPWLLSTWRDFDENWSKTPNRWKSCPFLIDSSIRWRHNQLWDRDERIMFCWRFSCTVVLTHFNTAVAISRYITASVSFSNCNVLRATGDAFDILASVCTNDDVILSNLHWEPSLWIIIVRTENKTRRAVFDSTQWQIVTEI